MKSGLDVLIINTYGGSLLVAARNHGATVRGSYEDVGYGTPVQRENFPTIDCRESRKDWADDSLKNSIVLAHPPCSAFSNMNNSAATKGTGSNAFKCTTEVLEYTMKLGAPAIAVESVCGAYVGAKEIHDHYARKHGYNVYRLLENSITYGVPQWRVRFWAMFVKKGLLPNDVLCYAHTPAFSPLNDFLEAPQGPYPVGPEVPKLEDQWTKMVTKLKGLQDTRTVNRLLSGKDGFNVVPVLATRAWEGKREVNRKEAALKYHWDGGGFACFWLKLLDPTGYAPTLLGSSWWGCHGRSLRENEYKRCMGFPSDYVFPGKHLTKFREYLSKGVCPPVAQEVLRTLELNVSGKLPKGNIKVECLPGGTIDLRVKKAQWPYLKPEEGVEV